MDELIYGCSVCGDQVLRLYIENGVTVSEHWACGCGAISIDDVITALSYMLGTGIQVIDGEAARTIQPICLN